MTSEKRTRAERRVEHLRGKRRLLARARDGRCSWRWQARSSARHAQAQARAGRDQGSHRVAVNVHLIPGVGARRLDRLEPEHLERLTPRCCAPAARRPPRTRLIGRSEQHSARRSGRITRKPAKLAKAPRPAEIEVEPYTVATAHGGPSRWPWACGRERRSVSAGRTSTSIQARSGSVVAGSVRGTPMAAEIPPVGSLASVDNGYRLVGDDAPWACPAELVVLLRAPPRRTTTGTRSSGTAMARQRLRVPEAAGGDDERSAP